MPALTPRPTDARRPASAQPLRRERLKAKPAALFRQRMLHFVLVFAAVVLVVDAFVGDKGLIETLKARREYRQVESSLNALRRENSRLREQVRLLHDPATIESVARRELGLIRPGEILFIIRDTKPVH